MFQADLLQSIFSDASDLLVIVRPDRYVFGAVDERWSLDRLIQELARKLELSPV